MANPYCKDCVRQDSCVGRTVTGPHAGGSEQSWTPLLRPEESTNTQPAAHKHNPTGEWKTGLLSCFRYGFLHSSFWTACCCPKLLLSQILARMDLPWHSLHQPPCQSKRGSEVHGVRSKQRMLIFFACLFVLEMILTTRSTFVRTDPSSPGQQQSSLLPESNGSFLAILTGCFVWNEVLCIVLTLPLTILTFWIVVKLRRTIRQRHEIETGCCGSAEDACCICFCSTCAIAQMARQTADYEMVSPNCCTTTGLAGAERISFCELLL